MKNLLGFLFALGALFLTSCTGGQESMTGEVDFLDYLPSVFMALGGVVAVLAVLKYFKGVKMNKQDYDQDLKDRGEGQIRGAYTIAFLGFIIFLFGLLTYLN